MEGTRSHRPLGIVIASVLMIVFGVAEVATGFSHNFFGLSTSVSAVSTYLGATLGLLYIVAGILALTMRRWAVYVAIAALILDLVGRVAMVVGGFYLLNSSKQTFSMVAGTLIAAIFAVYLGWRRDCFR